MSPTPTPICVVTLEKVAIFGRALFFYGDFGARAFFLAKTGRAYFFCRRARAFIFWRGLDS
jgi:hypothetical protein